MKHLISPDLNRWLALSELSHDERTMSDATARGAFPENLPGVVSHDLAATEPFDQITRLAAFCFGVRAAMISVDDGDKHTVVSTVGLNDDDRDVAEMLCDETMAHGGLVEIEDLLLARPRGVSLPTGREPMRFFAGIALVDDQGQSVAALCLIDTKPRILTAAERDQFTALGRLASNEVNLRHSDARRDPLTGLPNERQLNADMRAMASAHDGDLRLLVFIDSFDLASTRALTQVLGAGPIDALMVEIGQRLKARLEGIGDVYRLSESRFAILMEADAGFEPEAFIADLALTLGRTAVAAGIPIRPVIRVGLVTWRLHYDNVLEALRQASAAVDASVASNRTWTAYDAVNDARTQRSYTLATSLERALANKEFYLVYQPRLQLTSGKAASVEALVRWNHSMLGTLFPGEFIPIVERTSLMQALTYWVADTALAQLAIWRQDHPELHLSINLSPNDFETTELPAALIDLCARHGVPTNRLELEVKEGDWVRADHVFAQLNAIREAGMLVSIDDFGAGYSNSAYLRAIPADVIKLDQSLVADLDENERHQTIVQAILSLAHSLGYRTVAEGVESDATLQLLRAWHCDEAQGYVIARPAGAQAITSLLSRLK